jgi:large subunit ribosomal protein L6
MSSDRVGKISSKIRKLKLPEPYKGKGIIYEGEEIKLKDIKK